MERRVYMSNKLKLMNTISQGIYIIGTKMKDTYNFMTAAWITQVSFSPCKIAVSVDKSRYSADLIKKQGIFSVSVLTKGQEDVAKVCGFQSGKDVNKPERVNYELNKEGLPVIRNCAAQMTCKVIETFDAGDHFLFVAEIENGEVGQEEPLVYVSSDYFG